MPEPQAVILLHTLNPTDDFPCRSLTCKSESSQIEIGRASRRENKNLGPSRHNALFESRVMSRTHAILRVSPQKKRIYIRDPGSMHGTLLNEAKLPIDQELALSDGDVLTFGVEVVRGSETYPPLSVRCECQWLEAPIIPTRAHDSEPIIQKQPQTSNTFCVPDDDDDDDSDCQITAHNPISLDLTVDQNSQSDSSSVSSDSEDSRSVIEVASPRTSPPKNEDLKSVRQTEAPVVTAQQSLQITMEHTNEPVERSEHPLATPIMTPPSVDYEFSDEYPAHSADDAPGVWSLDGDEVEEEAEEEEEEEQEDEEEEEEEEEEEGEEEDNEEEAELGEDDDEGEDEDEYDYEEEAKAGEEDKTHLNLDFSDYVTASNCALPENTAPYKTLPPISELCTAPPHTHLRPPTFDSGSDAFAQPTGYPSVCQRRADYIPLIAQKVSSNFSLSFDPMALRSELDRDLGYDDGPFARREQRTDIGTNHINTVNHGSKPETLPFMDPFTPMVPRTSCDASLKPTVAKASLYCDGLDMSLEPLPQKKRKATDMDSPIIKAVAAETSKLEEAMNLDTDFPNAQHQNIAAFFNNSESQLTPLSIPEIPKPDESPRKRVKGSHTGSFSSHATTAFVGALVGAVGAVAALASLPADYFA
ncbi:hypothetical protein BJX99DRAFT_227025 [Aspergillus californicus]